MKWLGIILLLITFNFDQEKDYIIQDEDVVIKPPMTGKQSQELSKLAKQRRYQKTMGKYVPEVDIVNSNGDSIKLNSLIFNNTLISFSDYSCGWGAEYIQDIFPEVYECNYYNDSINFILMIKIDSAEFLQSKEGIEILDRQLYWYRNTEMVYFIEYEEAKKMNFFASPSHMITDNKGKVVFYNTGAHLPDFWLPLIDSLSGYQRN